MSKAAKSIFVFGVYMIFLGLGFTLFPKPLLNMVGYPPSDGLWVRMVGMLLLILAYYYIRAARHETVDFFRSTIHGRIAALPFFVAFVLMGMAPAISILFSVVDVAGAVWTTLVLRASPASK